MFGIGTVIGPIIGGALTENVTWRWCFYINLPVGAVTVLALLAVFHPPARRDEKLPLNEKIKKLDLVGTVLFIGAIIMVLIALQFGGNTYPWKSATIIGLFCGFGGLMLLFMAWQAHMGEEAMIPPRILMQRTVLTSCAATSFVFGSAFVTIYYIPE